jgi:hypothetical protein
MARVVPRQTGPRMPLPVISGEGTVNADGFIESAITALEINYPNEDTHEDNRCFWFDQEKLYRVPMGAHGGVPWYVWSLDSGPGSIDEDGYLNWTPDASTTTATWVVRLTDRAGTSVTFEYTATKDNSRFKYWNNSASSGGDGTEGDPWSTWLEVLEGDEEGTFLRVMEGSGDYLISGAPTWLTGSGASLKYEIEFDGSSGRGHHTTLIPDDGAEPVFDYEYTGTATPYIEYVGPNVFVLDIAFRRNFVKFVEATTPAGQAAVLCGVTTTETGPGFPSSNAGDFMIRGSGEGGETYGTQIRNCNFGTPADEDFHTFLKAYESRKVSFFRNTTDGRGGDWKDEVPDAMLVQNVYTNIVGGAVTGNMNCDAAETNVTSGQVWHDRMLSGEAAVLLADGPIRRVGTWHFVRCTMLVPCALNVLGSGARTDGDITFIHCVRADSNDGDIVVTGGADIDLIQDIDNLLSSDDGSVVNATTGVLVGSAATDHGPNSAAPRGFQL